MTTAALEGPKAELSKREIPLENGIVKLDSYESALRYATSIMQSGLAPAAFKSPVAILVAMQHGAELGLKPLASLQHIAVINGRPTLYGKALPALILPTGLMEEFEEWLEGDGPTLTACCKAKRKGIAVARTDKFSTADATKAGLWGKSGPWTQYPKDMLKYKARARCLGTLFADVLCGLPIFEDVREVYAAKPVQAKSAEPDPLLDKVAPEASIPDAEFTVLPDEPEAAPSPEYSDAENARLDKLARIGELLASKKLDELRAGCAEVGAWFDSTDCELLISVTSSGSLEALAQDGALLDCRKFLSAAKDRI